MRSSGGPLGSDDTSGAPSAFFLAEVHRLDPHRLSRAPEPHGSPSGALHAARVLDLASGRGRHSRPLLTAGHHVVAIDRDLDALCELTAWARSTGPTGRLAAVRADLEQNHAIPFASASFSAVLVFRYLHRPLASEIERLLAPGGLLLYETFTHHQRELPEGPRNPAFLLEPDELPTLFPGLRVLEYAELVTPGPRREALARMVACRDR